MDRDTHLPKPFSDAPDDIVLERYLAGEATASDCAAVETWLREDPARAARLATWRTMLQQGGDPTSSSTDSSSGVHADRVRRMERRFFDRIRAADQPIPVPAVPRLPMRGVHTRRFATAAALCAGLAGVLLAGVFFRRHNMTSVPPTARHVYTTNVGERAVITLDDGSRVTLAPQSRLAIADGFGRTTRRIDLAGEAYFDVTQTRGVPFIVHTGVVRTRVLGTQFDVRRYADEHETRVAVISGKISSGGRSAPVTLTAGATARITDSLITTRITDDARDYTKWTDGQLVFEDTPVPTMLVAVSRWTGYQFRLADSTLSGRHVTAVLTVGNRSETMQLLKDLLNVSMTFDGSVVTLRSRAQTATEREPSRSRMKDSFSTHTEFGR